MNLSININFKRASDRCSFVYNLLIQRLFYHYLLFFIAAFGNEITSQENPGAISGAPRQYMGTLQSFQKIRKLLNQTKKDTPLAFEDIKGSPYLNENFREGKIYLRDSLLDSGLLRYNIYSDEIEISENKKLYGLLKIIGSKIIIKNDTILLLNYIDDNKQKKKGYFLQIIDGTPIQLLKRLDCILTPQQKALTPNQKDRAAKFSIYESYYLKKHDENKNPIKIQLKRKYFFEEMIDQKEKVQNFIKQNNLNLKNEEDLKKLIKQYNNLKTKTL